MAHTLMDRAALALGTAAVPVSMAAAGIEPATITYDTVDYTQISASGDNVETLADWDAEQVNDNQGVQITGGFERLTADDMAIGFVTFDAGGEMSGGVEVGQTIPLAWDFSILWETSSRVPQGFSAADALTWTLTANVFVDTGSGTELITEKIEATDPNNFTGTPTSYSGSSNLVADFAGTATFWEVRLDLAWFDQQPFSLLSVDIEDGSIDLGVIPAPGTGLAMLGMAGLATRRRR